MDLINNEIFIVLSAAVLNFSLSSLWFLIVKRCSEQKQENSTSIIISFIGSLWASYGVFLMIKHISPNSVVEAISIGIGAWICILMALSAKHYSFNKRSLRCFVKDYLVDLFGLVLISLIIYFGI